jgi:hypothetical protein
MITEIVTQFLNWLSVQRYYADFGDILPQIYVTVIDILYYFSIFILVYAIASWILHPISARWGSNAKRKLDAEVASQIINLLAEQNLILLTINAEIRKHNTESKKEATDVQYPITNDSKS